LAGVAPQAGSTKGCFIAGLLVDVDVAGGFGWFTMASAALLLQPFNLQIPFRAQRPSQLFTQPKKGQRNTGVASFPPGPAGDVQ